MSPGAQGCTGALGAPHCPCRQGTARLPGGLWGAASWPLLRKELMQHMGIGQAPANKKPWLASCQELGGLASL